jgi:intein/homing endonuclease
VSNFKLTDAFISRYKGKEPNWGFNGLSELTFRRTYSTRNNTVEEWWEVCRRVVEGCYNIQKKHIDYMGLGWNAWKAQKSAQEMYDRMFNMKFLPPGRGLWAMGSDLTEERGLYTALFNCFTGEEQYLTRYGYKDFEHTKYTKQEILTENGEWKEAYIKPFGLAEIVELKLKRQGKTKTIRTTANHRWFAKSQSNVNHNKGWQEYTTEQLKEGYRLRYNFGQTANRKASPVGIQHGFIFGDGTTHPNNSYLQLQKGKDEDILKYFSNHEITEHDTYFYISSLPKHFKQLPETRYDTKYLYGFCSGYFAADGSVTADGQISISSANKNHLEKFQELCAICGIGSYEIRLSSTESNYSEERKLYQLTLMSHTLSEDFFLLAQHKANFKKKTKIPYWNVVSVKNTGEHEQVYCAVVPEKESFTLKDHIFTRNCAFVSTENIKEERAKPFCFLMDMLMVGCFAPDTYIMTAEGPRQIIDLVDNPFVAVVDSNPYLAPFGSWNTGYKDLYKISTKEGFEIKLTDNHLIQRLDNSWLSIDIGLQAGDQIVINDQSQVFFNWKGQGTYTEGYLAGIFVGDGYFSGHHANACVHEKDNGYQGILKHGEDCVSDIDRRTDAKGWRKKKDREVHELTIGTWIKNFGITNTETKTITKQVEQASKEFYIGFLKGLFDADGTVIDTEKNKDIRLPQSSFELLQATQRMLLRLGIYSTINIHRKEDEIHTIQGRKVNAKKSWYLKISKDSVVQYYETIGFEHTEKAKKLKKLVKDNTFYSTNFIATISSIEYIGKSDVYDVNVQEKHAVDANGIMAHNCGVGFDVLGAGKIDVKGFDTKRTPEVYIISDDREGWVESVKLLIESYLLGLAEVIFDYDQIRPAGEPIKGFGGTASGPNPLIQLHQRIRETLDALVGQPLTSTAIVDMMNQIGCCVVAGNVRRSSEIAIGEYDDKDFIDLKNYEANPHRQLWGWASNNTVIAKIGQDYTEIAQRIADNGEPGLFWIDNARQYGRINGDDNWRDRRVAGLNPCGEITLESYELCVSGNTRILTSKGNPKIQDKIEKEIEIWNGKEWSTVIPFQTGSNQNLYRITFSDGGYLDTTSLHRWSARTKSQLKFNPIYTKDLKPGMVLERFECPVLNVGDSDEHAYEYGWFVGDGFVDKNYPLAHIQKKYLNITKSMDCRIYDENILSSNDAKEPLVRINFVDWMELTTAKKLRSTEEGLPDFFFEWNTDSIAHFFGGWIDTDGSLIKQQNTDNYVIYGKEKQLRDAQILLRRIGINHATLHLNFKKGNITNKGIRNQDVWTLYIPSFECEIIKTRIKKAKRFGSKFKVNNAHNKSKLINASKRQKVISINKLKGKHNSYCFFEHKRGMGVFGNYLTYQCNLVENFPDKHDDLDDFLRTLKFAYLYSKTVTLTKSHWEETNRVMLRNRRVGCSISGIANFLSHHSIDEFKVWMQQGYETIQHYDEIYSEWMVVQKSIKTTTIKPSGCQRKDTLITTNEGIFTLEELGDIKGNTWQDINYTSGSDNITKFFVNGYVATKIIKTQDGNELEGSYQHQYKIYENNKIIWKKANDIKIGDNLVCSLGDYKKNYNPHSKKLIHINKDEFHHNSLSIKQPKYITKKFAWLLGLMFGDGSIHEKGIRISFNRKENILILKIKEVVYDLFGIIAYIDNDHSIYINSKMLLKFLEINGLLKSYSRDIAIPELIRSASYPCILAFINGLWRADGGTHNKTTWSICTISKKMAQQLLTVGRAIGLNLSIKNVGPGGWGSNDRWIITCRYLERNSARYLSKNLRSRKIKDNLWLDPVIEIIDSKNETFDLSVPNSNRYIANGVISHNTISLVAAQTPGMHYPESRFYIRRVRMSKFAPILPAVKKAGYHVEEDAYSDNTVVIEVPVDIGEGVKTINDVSMWEQMHLAALIQRYWSDNAVSCTVTVKPEEFDQIAPALDFFQYHLKAISMLPKQDRKTEQEQYTQLPYEAIEEDKYRKIVKRIKKINFKELTADFHDVEAEPAYCDGEKCEISQK